MDFTTAQIRDALAAAISNGVAGAWQVSAYMLALPQPPAIDLRPSGIRFDASMDRGNDDLSYTIRAFTAYNSDQGAQIKLDTLLDRNPSSTTGLKAILETDKTLGGVVADLRIMTASDYKPLTIEGQPPLLAVEFTVLVYP